ncbi:MAG: hypothetical protein A2189_02540 [Paenibacillus sp. RIFOXYA1_FULL_44_5]|nr:MAG: hypothetical protein A2189_02540 [Paenibacillus sp. RIFOXYA1_FULL_44_5]
MSTRPLKNEYNAYYEQYIGIVPEGSIQEILIKQLEETIQLLSTISEEQANSRYAPDKWTLKEVAGHIIDNERIMGYRLLRIARGDQTPLPGYEQDDFVREASFSAYTLAEIIEDYTAVRRASLTLLRGLSEQAWLRQGIANNNEISVKALAYILAGHELHHLKVIREKYLA